MSHLLGPDWQKRERAGSRAAVAAAMAERYPELQHVGSGYNHRWGVRIGLSQNGSTLFPLGGAATQNVLLHCHDSCVEVVLQQRDGCVVTCFPYVEPSFPANLEALLERYGLVPSGA